MNTNLDVEHKYKLGDKVWIKATAEVYRTCKHCKGQSKYFKTIKTIRGEIAKISISSVLESKPNIASTVTYLVKYKNSSTNAFEYQCFKTKKEANDSGVMVNFYGLQ